MCHFTACFRVVVFPVLGASRSHSDTPHLVGLLWKSDQPEAQTSTVPPPEFEPTIPASQRPQTHALHRAATGIGKCNY
jgi:hypothetical protein